MPSRWPILADAIKDQLTTLLSDDDTLVIERRLVPRFDRVEFEPGERYITLYCGAYGQSIIGRQVDREEWDTLIAIQSAGPDPTASAGENPFANVTSADADPVAWGDDVFDLVERVKAFWRAETDLIAEGALRSLELAGCYFQTLEHNPTYLPAHLEEYGILSIVLRLSYRVSDFNDPE
jgi:hypothetical protein